MDLTLLSHSIKTFNAAISTLSRIGKDLYIEFDPTDGLVLHTLNDAKSAYACIRFRTAFFERCTTPLDTKSSGTKRRLNKSQIDNNNDADTNGNDSDNDLDDRFLCRVPLRTLAVIIRPRKGILSLRIRTDNSHGVNGVVGGINNNTIEEQSIRSFLSFEFQLQSSDTILAVTHRVPIASETSCQRAVTDKTDISELVASPSVWLRLLESHRTNEVALIVRNNRTGPNGDISSSVSATSFHHSLDTIHGVQQQQQRGGRGNAIALAASASVVKTEATIGCEELEEFDFVSNRTIDHDNNHTIPASVNEQVVLVFCLKEAKAMLQFCSSVRSSWGANNGYANFMDQAEQAVSISFHWGGKPLVIETTTIRPSNERIVDDLSAVPFSATLVLATLDHSLLIAERTMSLAR